MISVEVGELSAAVAAAVVRPVATDFSPVTPAMRRFDEQAGGAVLAQCARLGDLPLGSAAITAGGDTGAGFIVHVAVRSAAENATSGVIRRGLTNALRRLSDWEIDTVTLVPLGTGAGNLDAEESAEAMVPILTRHMRAEGGVRRATILVEDAYQEEAFLAAVTRYAGTGAGESGEASASGERVGT